MQSNPYQALPENSRQDGLSASHESQLLTFRLTPGNVDDRTPVKDGMLSGLWGKIFGDKGDLTPIPF